MAGKSERFFNNGLNKNVLEKKSGGLLFLLVFWIYIRGRGGLWIFLGEFF
jgi:hypothetical protein